MKSKYEITRDENHAYTVKCGDVVVTLPGVTGILDIVGSKDKVNRLMGWAKKQCLLKVADHMRAFITKPVTIDEAWIEACRKSAWKRDKEVLKAAGDLGTAVHAAIDAFILGQEPVLDDTTRPGYENFLFWIKTSGINLVRGDSYVASLRLKYGGAADAIGEKNGKLILLDWKTSNYLSDTNALQAAAYSVAFEETFGEKIETAYVVRFGKETPGDIEPKEVYLPAAKKAWYSALDLHEAMTGPIWRIEGEMKDGH